MLERSVAERKAAEGFGGFLFKCRHWRWRTYAQGIS